MKAIVLADMQGLIYINCVDRGYLLEDVQGTIDDTDGWWEKVRELSAIITTW